MKPFQKRWWAAAIVLVLAGLLIYPEVRYRTALRKYKLGTAAEALDRQYGIHLKLRKNGNYLEDEASDYEKRLHVGYDARVRGDFVLLYFNDFHEINRVIKMTPGAKVCWWLCPTSEEAEMQSQANLYKLIVDSKHAATRK